MALKRVGPTLIVPIAAFLGQGQVEPGWIAYLLTKAIFCTYFIKPICHTMLSDP